jgi:hypothetical protein
MAIMKVLVCWWCLGLTAVQAAGTVRKRVRNPFEILDEQLVAKTPPTRGLEEDIAEELRHLEVDTGFSMSMSMPAEPPTRDEETHQPTTAPAPETPTTAPPVTPTTAPAPVTPPTRVSVVPTFATTQTPTQTPTSVPSPGSTDNNRDQLVQEKCGVTALERSRDILSILTLISVPVNLITPDSPQFMARDWLDHQDSAIICANNVERISQRYRAALLYYHLGGEEWTNCRAEAHSDFNDLCLEEDVRKRRRIQEDEEFLQNSAEREGVRFLNESNECEWFGMDCGEDYDSDSGNNDDAYFPMKTIDLSENNLGGEIFVELFGFLELEGLFMDGNRKISGTIPEDLGNLKMLRFFDLDDNALTGEIPNAIYGMTELRAIDLNENNLEGEISNDIGNLVNLEVLQLEKNNSFSGAVLTEGLFKLLWLEVRGW